MPSKKSFPACRGHARKAPHGGRFLCRRSGSSAGGRDERKQKRPDIESAFSFCGGERGIRTPGTLRFSGFQDRRNRPLCHLSVRRRFRSEEHTSELQSLMRISYAVFCLKKKIIKHQT